MRTQSVKAIYEAALSNRNIVFLTGDLDHEYRHQFEKNIPSQHINVGMAEQNMVGIASGLALSGKKAFVFSITPFATMRCYEQIRDDVCYQDVDVTIVGVGAGYAYSSSGCTHHAIEDIAIMRALPNMKIFSPAHPPEAKIITQKIILTGGPAYLRISRKNDPIIPELSTEKYEDIENGSGITILSGSELTIFSTGSILIEALEAAKILTEHGLSTEIVNVHTLKPFDKKLITDRLNCRGGIFTLEEHNVMGGLGSIIAEIVAETSLATKPVFKMFGIQDQFMHHVGSLEFLRKSAGIDGQRVASDILKVIR